MKYEQNVFNKRWMGCIVVLVILVIFLAVVGAHNKNLSNNITSVVNEENKDEEIKLINLNVKYILNTWWNSEKYVYGSSNIQKSVIGNLTENQKSEVGKSLDSFKNWEEQEYIYLVADDTVTYENVIRPCAHACFVISVALYTDIYDEDITGIEQEKAEKMVCKLINSLAENYAQGKWSKQWQSPLWAENIGFAAWLLWDNFNEDEKAKIYDMIITEADFITYEYITPYYRDKFKNIVYEGDTRGEETAWDSRILALSTCMLPEHENCIEWKKKLIELLVSSTATPEDARSQRTVDGYVLSEVLNGSNINSDGTVINHGKCHIDYMATIVEGMLDTYIIYKIAGYDVPEAATFNFDLVYNALVNVDLGEYDSDKEGHHFYERDEKGNPIQKTNMPGENDWGGYWYASYYLMDTTSVALGIDNELEDKLKADKWKALHFEELKRMIMRNTDGEVTGQIFQDGENSFVSGDLYMMQNLCKAYLIENY